MYEEMKDTQRLTSQDKEVVSVVEVYPEAPKYNYICSTNTREHIEVKRKAHKSDVYKYQLQFVCQRALSVYVV